MSNPTVEQRAYHLRKMRTRFTRLDLNNDGFISREDYDLMATKLLEYNKMGEEESMRKIFANVADRLGLKLGVRVPVEEAAKEASTKLMAIAPEERWDMLHMSHNTLFDALDLNKDGHISLEEFKIYFQIVGPDISEVEMTNSFNTIDKNKDGEISREEFPLLLLTSFTEWRKQKFRRHSLDICCHKFGTDLTCIKPFL